VKEIVGAQGGLLVCSSLEMSSPLTCDPEPSERFLVQSVLDFQGFAFDSSSFLFRSETLLSLLISFLPTITLFSVRVTHTHTHTFSFGNSSFFAYLFPYNNNTIFRSSYHLSSDLCFFFFFFFMADCHFVSDSHEVMTALIVVLPIIVFVEISLQLHQASSSSSIGGWLNIF
jgi:hypothetical protein